MHGNTRPSLTLGSVLAAALAAAALTGCTALLDFDKDGMHAVEIRAGAQFTCAQFATGGALYCWGSNDFGQGGAGLYGDPYWSLDRPTQVLNLPHASFFELGYSHACAVEESGQLSCWGENDRLQIGTIGESHVDSPVRVQTALHTDAVGLGEGYTCYISAALLYCFGDNRYYQLTEEESADRTHAPVQIPFTEGPTQIAAGRNHVCALMGNSSVWCWGHSDFGQIGVGATPPTEPCGGGDTDHCVTTPQMLALDQAQQVVSGGDHTCALNQNAELWCWGLNAAGQCGVAASQQSVVEPTLVDTAEGVSGWLAVAVGGNHTCAIASGGEVWCWGLNDRDQIGTGQVTVDFFDVPQKVELPRAAASLALGEEHSCAILNDRRVFCWGSNYGGQILNHREPAPTPVLLDYE